MSCWIIRINVYNSSSPFYSFLILCVPCWERRYPISPWRIPCTFMNCNLSSNSSSLQPIQSPASTSALIELTVQWVAACWTASGYQNPILYLDTILYIQSFFPFKPMYTYRYNYQNSTFFLFNPTMIQSSKLNLSFYSILHLDTIIKIQLSFLFNPTPRYNPLYSTFLSIQSYT